jgi:hypothetical protein
MRRVISCAFYALIAVLTACGGGNSSSFSSSSPSSPAGAGHSYSTAFSLTENPISEGSNWYNGGADGNDSIAILKGTWKADQTAQATVYVNGPSGTYSPEVELFLRGSIQSHSATGYEINFSASGNYQQIVRWNGPLGNFTYLSSVNLPIPLPVEMW